MTHCKRFLECKERLWRNPESPYYKGGGQYYASDCRYCHGFEEEVQLERQPTLTRNVSLNEYNQLRSMVYDTRKQLQLSLKERNQYSKKKSKYE
jgi:hypothetical protein